MSAKLAGPEARPHAAPVSRVLILDDDVHIADLLRLVLVDDGHEVFIGTRADALPDVRVDLVLTDLMDLTAYSRAHAREWIASLAARYPSTPIVVVTAHAEAARDEDALGAARVIMKPFDVDQISQVVRETAAG